MKINLSQKPCKIMGILNVTDDSFYDGGRYTSIDTAIERGRTLAKEGADIIDIGAESTRPGAMPINVNEELQRLVPVIQALKKEIHIPISVDSYKPEVIRECVPLGIDMINDVTGLRNKSMVDVVIKSKLPVVVMHMRGTPQTMQQDIHYDDVVKEIYTFFEKKLHEIDSAHVIIDPGIGFGKEVDHNLLILKNLSVFKTLGCPILIGTSRKSFIGKVLELPSPIDRLSGTLASCVYAYLQGANILRVHDVREVKQAIKLIEAIEYVSDKKI